MATVKKIVEEHGGTVDVTSEEGEGTVVTLVLPDTIGSLKVAAPTEDSTDEFRIMRPKA
jgi:chemotaxis protein histidine kinase CheA